MAHMIAMTKMEHRPDSKLTKDTTYLPLTSNVCSDREHKSEFEVSQDTPYFPP